MKLRSSLLALALCALCAGQASALEYTVDAPPDYLFGRPTSESAAYEQMELNVDRSKNVALIPPGFGSPTSYLPDSGEALTPNLVPGALSGGLVSQIGPVNYPAVDNTAQPLGGGQFAVNQAANQLPVTAFTDVTADLYYDGGQLGTLQIPAIDVDVKVYEGTDSTQLAKGAGHFIDTSIWDGNVVIAGHNRGANCYFGNIHTLTPGDSIALTTKLGTRTYSVASVEKVLETDTGGTAATSDNQIPLYTCVRDESAYRWCVKGMAQTG